MKTTQTVMLAVLLALGLGCGYSKHSNMPATPGIMPAITQLNPSSQPAGGAAFTLEVDGSNFTSQAVINFNNSPQMSTQWVNSDKVTVTIPTSSIMNAGQVPVTVTNPGTPGGPYGGGTQPATSNTVMFTIQ